MGFAKYISLVLPGLLIGLSASAQEVPAGVIMVNPATAPASQWIGSPSGQILNLLGDLYTQGPYVFLLKAAKGRIMASYAHTHAEDRTYTVISGTWYVGFGTKFDESQLIALPAGSFYTEPKGVPHFVMAKDDGVVVQISGSSGPASQEFIESPLR